MKLEESVTEHSHIRARLKRVVAEREPVDVSTLGQEHGCELGRWLHGKGMQTHQGLPSFNECLKKHAAFHAEAARVAVAIRTGKFGWADAMLNRSDYTNADAANAEAILALKAEAKL